MGPTPDSKLTGAEVPARIRALEATGQRHAVPVAGGQVAWRQFDVDRHEQCLFIAQAGQGLGPQQGKLGRNRGICGQAGAY